MLIKDLSKKEEKDQEIKMDLCSNSAEKTSRSSRDIFQQLRDLPLELQTQIYEFDPTYKRTLFSRVIKQVHQLRDHCPKCNRIANNGFSIASECHICYQNREEVYWCQSCNFTWCSPKSKEIKKYRDRTSDFLNFIPYLNANYNNYEPPHCDLTREIQPRYDHESFLREMEIIEQEELLPLRRNAET